MPITHTQPRVTRWHRSSRIEARHVRVTIEQNAQTLFVRLRPPEVPEGASGGPRVALELAPVDAIALADELRAHALALQEGRAAVALPEVDTTSSTGMEAAA